MLPVLAAYLYAAQRQVQKILARPFDQLMPVEMFDRVHWTDVSTVILEVAPIVLKVCLTEAQSASAKISVVS